MAKKKEEKNERTKKFDDAIKNINKKYGENTVIRLGDATSVEVDVITTGALSLDLALGIGGIPKGRITEIYGPESSGKSTLCLTVAKYCQQNGGNVAYIDAENSIDIEYAANIGVNVNDLLLSQPDDAEQAFDVVGELVESAAADLIIIDSLAALVPRKELEGDFGDQHVALQARLVSQALRKLTTLVNKTKTAIIFINQLRSKIGVYGNPEDTPGGRALKYYASLRIDIRRREYIKKGDNVLGNAVRSKIAKNKLAVPFKEAMFEIIFGRGIKKVSAIFEAAINNNVITKEGNTYSYGEVKLGVGKNNALSTIKSDKKLTEKIEVETRKRYEENKNNFDEVKIEEDEEEMEELQ